MNIQSVGQPKVYLFMAARPIDKLKSRCKPDIPFSPKSCLNNIHHMSKSRAEKGPAAGSHQVNWPVGQGQTECSPLLLLLQPKNQPHHLFCRFFLVFYRKYTLSLRYSTTRSGFRGIILFPPQRRTKKKYRYKAEHDVNSRLRNNKYKTGDVNSKSSIIFQSEARCVTGYNNSNTGS